MSKNKQAFPYRYSENDWEEGLTKREYFAVCAMQGLISNDYLGGDEHLVRKSVELADELIEKLDGK